MATFRLFKIIWISACANRKIEINVIYEQTYQLSFMIFAGIESLGGGGGFAGLSSASRFVSCRLKKQNSIYCFIFRTLFTVLFTELYLLFYLQNSIYCFIYRTLFTVLFTELYLLFYFQNSIYCFIYRTLFTVLFTELYLLFNMLGENIF